MGALDWMSRRLTIATVPTKHSSDFIALPEVLDRPYGPKRGLCIKPVVIVLDDGPIHTNKAHDKRLRPTPTGSRSNGCQNMRPTQWYRGSLARSSKPIISPIRQTAP
jgi:hypothetical protein